MMSECSTVRSGEKRPRDSEQWRGGELDVLEAARSMTSDDSWQRIQCCRNRVRLLACNCFVSSLWIVFANFSTQTSAVCGRPADCERAQSRTRCSVRVAPGPLQ